ncbi:MAG TPA: biopolymer transporter ExbD [Candidatus Manganitrophaceae bacterium]|nr:biopolymer transporter ExbD [Candidatus Manganitrophaceae bacterium]
MQRGIFKKKKKALAESALLSFKLGYINLMITLVPVLLSIAVFSRLAIVDLHLPRLGGGSDTVALQNSAAAPSSRISLMVAIRREGVAVLDGDKELASFPKRENKLDFASLSRFMQKLKSAHPDENEVVILSQPQTPYEELIAVMDACRSAKVNGTARMLFSNVSLGEIS